VQNAPSLAPVSGQGSFHLAEENVRKLTERAARATGISELPPLVRQRYVEVNVKLGRKNNSLCFLF
jgi:hypothetical protein